MPERYFLHVGKTGGTAIKTAIGPFAEARSLQLGKHDLALPDVPAGAQALFCVRDPCERFVSGFNSRQRQGRPRFNIRWTEDEALAFGRFATPNALAEALSSDDERLRAHAAHAMNGISHTGMRLSYWFVSSSYLRKRRGDILWIGHQPSLAEDFDRLKALLDLPDETGLPSDPVASHRTPPDCDTALSAAGQANIAHWYRKDVEIYATCLELRAEMLAAR